MGTYVLIIILAEIMQGVAPSAFFALGKASPQNWAGFILIPIFALLFFAPYILIVIFTALYNRKIYKNQTKKIVGKSLLWIGAVFAAEIIKYIAFFISNINFRGSFYSTLEIYTALIIFFSIVILFTVSVINLSSIAALLSKRKP